MATPTEVDEKLMARAIELAQEGDPSPNPRVGALVAFGEKIIAEGFHAAAGEEHAEVRVLHEAGTRAKGKTLYATLEPCNHEGKTPPCTDEILNAGIKRVVIGCRDPNPKVTGGGLHRLEEAGIEVVVGVLETQAQELIKPWKKYITQQVSYLSLKLAVSLDGRIATRTGASKWISSPEARTRVQTLRSKHDAVMVGINTVLADDPKLTVRDVPGRSPIRLVMDSRLRIPASSQLVGTARDVPTAVITTNDASPAMAQQLEDAGLKIIRVPATAEGRCDLGAALQELAAREVVSVLCEGGAELAGTMLAAGLPDEMHCFVAPLLLGPRGRPGAVDWAGPDEPEDAPRISAPRWELCGADAYVSGPLAYPKKKIRTTVVG